MNNRTLLIVALALMAGGLLIGGIDLVAGGFASPVESQQPFAPNGQEGQNGPEGGLRPHMPELGPEREPGEASRKLVPRPAASPKPAPTATPSP